MNIEINNQDLEALAELVFMGELAINGARFRKKIAKYIRVKQWILKAYRSTLTEGRQEYLADEDGEDDYFMGKLGVHVILNEAAVLLEILQGKLWELSKESDIEKNASDKILKWKGDGMRLLAEL